MDGILNINKPAGMTSYSVVARVKRLTGEKHTGHAGTLDPLATGVLPVCLGQATRVIEYLFDETKTYRSEIELGKSTDTYDGTGKVLRECDPAGITLDMINSGLPEFRGEIIQTPPMYSALKLNGRPLYELAREGIEVERKSRPVRVFSLEIKDWQPPVVTLEIVCGKGTYIRCIAHDLGEKLGCGAHLKSLVRLKVGPFDISEALSLPRLELLVKAERIRDCLHPIDSVLTGFPALVVNREQQCALIHGNTVSLETPSVEPSSRLSRAYTTEGNFLGMLRYDPENRLWRPEKMFFRCCSAN